MEEAEEEEREVEEVEDLLEYYLQRAAATQSEAERLLDGARDLEESIGVSLSARRFEVGFLLLLLQSLKCQVLQFYENISQTFACEANQLKNTCLFCPIGRQKHCRIRFQSMVSACRKKPPPLLPPPSPRPPPPAPQAFLCCAAESPAYWSSDGQH